MTRPEASMTARRVPEIPIVERVTPLEADAAIRLIRRMARDDSEEQFLLSALGLDGDV